MEKVLARLAEQLPAQGVVLIVSHDNPDPDGLAAARGLQFLLRESFGVKSVVGFAGVLGRAENRAMVRLLKLDLRPMSELKLARFAAVALVDSQPGTGNNSLPRAFRPDVVIDHHPLRSQTRRAPFADVRPGLGATSTIITEYIQAAGLTPSRPVATGLFYGIRTDTRSLALSRLASDQRALQFLFPHISQRQLARIESPRLPRRYFVALGQALARVMIHRDVLVADMGEVRHPDELAELAQAFLRLEGMGWTLFAGTVGERSYFSLRSTRGKPPAGGLARRVAGRGGRGGGHEKAAAGYAALHGREDGPKVRAQFLQRFLRALGREEVAEVPLIERPAATGGGALGKAE